MERLATQKLIEWNKSTNRKPLIVWGARQVGKTYLVKDIFADKYYKDSYIYIDCKKEDEIREFCFSTANAEKIIEFISLQKGRQIDSKTLLIFDEVQECPNIISALKYFCQDFIVHRSNQGSCDSTVKRWRYDVDIVESLPAIDSWKIKSAIPIFENQNCAFQLDK